MTTTPTIPIADDEPGDDTVELTRTPEGATRLDGADFERAMRATCARIAPLWPLESFVAVNPYLGLADLRFGEAAELLASTAGARSTMQAAFYLDAIEEGRIGDTDLAAALAGSSAGPPTDVASWLQTIRDGQDESTAAARVPTVAAVATAVTGHDWIRLSTDRVSGWAAAYFDSGQALWKSADPNRPLFAAWKEEASIDRTPEVMGLRGFRATVRSLPDDPFAAAEQAVHELGIPDEALELYLHALLLRVGGWAAHAARVVWDQGLLGEEDDTLVQFLAVLLGWELAVLHAGSRHGVPAAWAEAAAQLRSLGARPPVRQTLEQRLVLQDAFDRSAQRHLIEQLASHPITPPGPGRRPTAQAVFCIDVRSEVIRRHLEATADGVDTIGFAGFFGFAIEYVPLAHDRGEAQCPVLLTPGYTVAETVLDPARQEEAIAARRLVHHVRRAWKSFKMGAISCFSFVGPVGLIYLPKLFTDGHGVTRPVTRPEDEALPSWAVGHTAPSLDSAEPMTAAGGVASADRIELAEGALRGMSLTDNFAPLVMIVGHGAATVNNPYATGLDCGACGGHTGENNARVAAAILNDAEVRQALATRGICVPDDTWFVAGLHNTTTDELQLFDTDLLPPSHAPDLERLRGWLAEAGRRARRERAASLGLAASAAQPDVLREQMLARSTDWAQTRPEWGLADCASFIVAPRSRSRHLDLRGRSFLHDYAWQRDSGFQVLELVMTAPMVVTNWINLQYYASTVDNPRYGSGNKVLHNVVGGHIGVFEGNGGDLRIGLPLQSVHDGEHWRHTPLRLSVFIQAPQAPIDDIIVRHATVRQLLDHEWLHLFRLDDAAGCWRYSPGGGWQAVAA